MSKLVEERYFGGWYATSIEDATEQLAEMVGELDRTCRKNGTDPDWTTFQVNVETHEVEDVTFTSECYTSKDTDVHMSVKGVR